MEESHLVTLLATQRLNLRLVLHTVPLMLSVKGKAVNINFSHISFTRRGMKHESTAPKLMLCPLGCLIGNCPLVGAGLKMESMIHITVDLFGRVLGALDIEAGFASSRSTSMKHLLH